MPADSIDHVPPVSVRAALVEADISHLHPQKTVQACRECNSSLLGAISLWTVTERKAYVKKALRKKYQRFLNIPNWDRDELEQMDERSLIRKHIEDGLVVRDIIRQRIAW